MIPVEKNKEYVACIDSVSSDGNGVAHIDGFAVFLEPQTVDGDKIKMLVVKVQKILHTVRRWRLQNRRINVVSLCANIIKGVAVAKFVI